MIPRSLAAALAVLLLAGALRADEERGLELTRQAQAALGAGDAEGALKLLEQARTEWPGSGLVANTLGDVHRALGQLPEAALEYARAMHDDGEYHARFNRAVTLHDQAEMKLGEAAVPLDPAGLPEGSHPEMLTAIDAQLGTLDAARADFLRALELNDDLPGRESLAAINRRLDDLHRMRDQLAEREEKDKKKEDGKDQQDDTKQDQDQQDNSQDPADQKKDSEDPQDQKDKDEPQDPKDGKDDGKDGQEPKDGADQPPSDQPPDANPQAAPRELSKEEVQQLMDKLEQLEKQGRELQKARLAAERRSVEKDW